MANAIALPLDALKSWRAKSPDLFKKRPKNLPGLDSYGAT